MVTLPESPTVERALTMARRNEHPAIANHSVRTAHLAILIAELEQNAELPFQQRETIAVAGILHDIGATARFNGNLRFEVDGADAAANFVSSEGWESTKSGTRSLSTHHRRSQSHAAA